MKTVAQARAEGQLGLDLATRAARAEWLDLATDLLHECCLSHATLICDDVWALGLESCEHDRAFGAVMRRGVANGWMEPTRTYRPSIRSHGSGKPVYRSLIYRGRDAA